MAKVTVAGQAVVVTSELTLEDIKKIKKYRPDALTLKGGEDGKEPIFAIGIGDGGINTFGVSFNQETHDDEKKATLTMMTDYEGDDIKGFVADKIGAAITNLNKLEDKLPDVVSEIDAEKETIMSGITIAQ